MVSGFFFILGAYKAVLCSDMEIVISLAEHPKQSVYHSACSCFHDQTSACYWLSHIIDVILLLPR